MALQLERPVRVRLDGIGDFAAKRALTSLQSGSFDGMPLAEAVRRCQDDAKRFPENRTWILRVTDWA